MQNEVSMLIDTRCASARRLAQLTIRIQATADGTCAQTTRRGGKRQDPFFTANVKHFGAVNGLKVEAFLL